jgi:hypothetical protein
LKALERKTFLLSLFTANILNHILICRGSTKSNSPLAVKFHHVALILLCLKKLTIKTFFLLFWTYCSILKI